MADIQSVAISSGSACTVKRNPVGFLLTVQVTKLISDIDSAIESNEYDKTMLNVLLARLTALRTQLNEVDATIEPLVPDGDTEQSLTQFIEYNNRILTYPP